MSNLFPALTASVAALALATPALAECAISKQKFENEIVSGELRGAHFGQIVKDMRTLRTAVDVLDKYDRPNACAEVVSAMRAIAETPPQNMALRKVTDLGGKIRVEDILDAEIRDKDNTYIGAVENVVVDANGGPVFLIVEHGGFLGLGQEQTAIPFKALQISPDGAAYFIDMTEEQFADAPRYKRDEVDWSSQQDWRGKVNNYYDVGESKSKS